MMPTFTFISTWFLGRRLADIVSMEAFWYFVVSLLPTQEPREVVHSWVLP